MCAMYWTKLDQPGSPARCARSILECAESTSLTISTSLEASISVDSLTYVAALVIFSPRAPSTAIPTTPRDGWSMRPALPSRFQKSLCRMLPYPCAYDETSIPETGKLRPWAMVVVPTSTCICPDSMRRSMRNLTSSGSPAWCTPIPLSRYFTSGNSAPSSLATNFLVSPARPPSVWPPSMFLYMRSAVFQALSMVLDNTSRPCDLSIWVASSDVRMYDVFLTSPAVLENRSVLPTVMGPSIVMVPALVARGSK